jgi:hypothetical protein
MMHRLRGVVLPAVIACAVITPVGATARLPEGAVQSPQRRLPRDPQNMSPGELQRLFDAYTLMKAQEALALSDEQYGKFALRLRELQRVRRANVQRHTRLLQQLNRLTKQSPPATAQALSEALQALQDHDTAAHVALRRAYQGVDEVLNVNQQARFRIIEQQIERRKLELIAQARERQRLQRRTAPRDP